MEGERRDHAPSPAPHEVHHLEIIPGLDLDLREGGAVQDLAVVLHHHQPVVDAQRGQQLGNAQARRDLATA